jgi:hypothetical protein
MLLMCSNALKHVLYDKGNSKSVLEGSQQDIMQGQVCAGTKGGLLD